MSHEIYTVIDFEIVGDHTLRVTFNDKTSKSIDLSPMLRGEISGPLRDLTLFNQVRLDTEAGTIVWPNDADFDPATLHDWDKVGNAMIEMARTWTQLPTLERAHT